MQYLMTVIHNGTIVEQEEMEDHEVDRYIVLEAQGMALARKGTTTTITRSVLGDVSVRTIDSSGGTIVTTTFKRQHEED